MAVTAPGAEPLDPDAPAARTRPARTGRGLTLLLIGLGGAVGTSIRAALEGAYPSAVGAWPWATFFINVSGAFVLAVLLETLSVTGPDEGWRRRVRFGVGTGLLGGYTTYSTFMVEAARLGRSGAYLTAFGYTTVSLVLGFAAALAGMLAVAALHRRWAHT
ncbi:fluoride efflux transporter FluC [Tessaracoccus antarcticus]|uniref:fluoride efflux transporter FluC n=1 Tax=Tessaracoccus antarcticus TaxID=2479848 RepID=UPI0018F5BBD4|nr:CrcB family protein [Tessaracoccus antarcticus]